MPIRFVARRIERFFIYRVLHVDDTPHRIALGVAIGIFVTWTPTIGLQMVLTILLAMLLRANKFVGVPFVWISNPLTIVPVYGPNYWIGSKLLGEGYTWSRFIEATAGATALTGTWTEKVQAYWSAFWPIFPPLWMGSIMMALVLGGITYPLIRYAVVAYRRRRELRRGRRHAGGDSVS